MGQVARDSGNTAQSLFVQFAQIQSNLAFFCVGGPCPESPRVQDDEGMTLHGSKGCERVNLLQLLEWVRILIQVSPPYSRGQMTPEGQAVLHGSLTG